MLVFVYNFITVRGGCQIENGGMLTENVIFFVRKGIDKRKLQSDEQWLAAEPRA